MNKKRRIQKKIEKIYKRPVENLYSSKFYNQLFTGYERSLNKDRQNRRGFYKIIPNDNELLKLFENCTQQNFSYEFEETINSVLYNMAIYEKSYIFIKPEYVEKIDEKGKCNKIINNILIKEVRGIQNKNIFYYKTISNEIYEFNTNEGTLITFNLRELGYKRKHFTKIVKQLGKYDIISTAEELINNERIDDFSVHIDKNRKRFLRKLRNIGLIFEVEEFSDSYILYKEIQLKQFQMRMLKYVLDKINKVLTEEYISNKEFKIEAMIEDVDYKDLWMKFQNGEITVSDLSDIVMK